MKRRANSFRLSLLFGACMALTGIVHAATDKPNILFIVSDDTGYGDLGPYGKQVVLFYTQTKTITARWFDEDAVSTVNTTISLR